MWKDRLYGGGNCKKLTVERVRCGKTGCTGEETVKS